MVAVAIFGMISLIALCGWQLSYPKLRFIELRVVRFPQNTDEVTYKKIEGATGGGGLSHVATTTVTMQNTQRQPDHGIQQQQQQEGDNKNSAASKKTQLSPSPTPLFTAVIPTIFKDFQRLHTLASTCRKLLKHDHVAQVFVVVPESDVPKFQQQIWPTHWKIVSDVHVVPELRDYPRRKGWYRQQDVKILSHRVADTPFVLLLDSDIVCSQGWNKPLTAFLSADQSKVQTCTEPTRGKTFYGYSSGIRDATAKVFNLSIPRGQDQKGGGSRDSSSSNSVMGWTPQIFSTVILKSLEKFISQKVGMPYVQALMELGRPALCNRTADPRCSRPENRYWTEYFLYELAAKEQNLWHKYHSDRPLQLSIERGGCARDLAALETQLASAKGCLKARIDCAHDFQGALYTDIVPFLMLNDHSPQLSGEEVEAILQRAGLITEK